MTNRISKGFILPDDPRVGACAWRPLTTLGAPRLDLNMPEGFAQIALAGSHLLSLTEALDTASCTGALNAHRLATAGGGWTTLAMPESFTNRFNASASTVGASVLLWGGFCRGFGALSLAAWHGVALSAPPVP